MELEIDRIMGHIGRWAEGCDPSHMHLECAKHNTLVIEDQPESMWQLENFHKWKELKQLQHTYDPSKLTLQGVGGAVSQTHDCKDKWAKEEESHASSSSSAPVEEQKPQSQDVRYKRGQTEDSNAWRYKNT